MRGSLDKFTLFSKHIYIFAMTNNNSFLNRPPLNLLRQELAGTSIYLDILLKATSGFDTIEAGREKNVNNVEVDTESANGDLTSPQDSSSVNNVDGVAENKLVSFCEQALREASDLQSSAGEATHMDVHRVLELRSPVIVKVLLISWPFNFYMYFISFIVELHYQDEMI